MKYLRPPECLAIINACTSDRDRLTGILLWRTGCRVSELLGLEPQHVDRHTLTIQLQTLKRRRLHIRYVPIDRSTTENVFGYCAANGIGPGSYIFPVSRQWVHRSITRAGEKAGIDSSRCHPHAFRHAFGIQAILSGVPVPILKAWLGHSSVNSTMVYTDVTAADARVYYDRMTQIGST